MVVALGVKPIVIGHHIRYIPNLGGELSMFIPCYTHSEIITSIRYMFTKNQVMYYEEPIFKTAQHPQPWETNCLQSMYMEYIQRLAISAMDRNNSTFRVPSSIWVYGSSCKWFLLCKKGESNGKRECPMRIVQMVLNGAYTTWWFIPLSK